MERQNDAASRQREPRNELGTDAPLGKGHALVGDQRRPTERAVEVEVVQPAVEAAPMEHVAARKPSNLVPIPERALADDALADGIAIAAVHDGVSVGDAAVVVELLGENDQAGEARSDGAEESVIDDDRVRVESGQAERLEEAEKQGAEVADAVGDESQKKNRNRI